MFKEERQKQVFEKVKKYFEENKSDYLHDIDHVIRVIYWATILSEKENGDSSIIIPAAILHDIARSKYGEALHARKGAEMCKPFLKDYGYNPQEIKRISETILMHSRDDPGPPETIEAQVLFDADKLDATGPAGLHRFFFEFAKKGYLHHKTLEKSLALIQEWKEKYGDPPFFTESGKEIGKERLKYVEDECKEILQDLEQFKDFYNLL